MHPEFKHWGVSIDQTFLERIGLADRQEVWMQLCIEQVAEGQPEY
jgi:hypothetical protein